MRKPVWSSMTFEPFKPQAVHMETFRLAPPPKHHETSDQPPGPNFWSHFWTIWGSCPVLTRKSCYVNNKPFHSLFAYMWCSLSPQHKLWIQIHNMRAMSFSFIEGLTEDYGLPSSSKESACQCRRLKRTGFNRWVRKIPWSRKWQYTPALLPGNFHGQRRLVGYSPWGHKELRHDWATEHTRTSMCTLRTTARERALKNCSEEVEGEINVHLTFEKGYMQPSTHLGWRLMLITRHRYLTC